MTYKEALDKRAAQLPTIRNGRVPSAGLVQRGGATYAQTSTKAPAPSTSKSAVNPVASAQIQSAPKSTPNAATKFTPDWARHLFALKWAETHGVKDPLHATNKHNKRVLGQFQQTKDNFYDGTGIPAVDETGYDWRTNNTASRLAVIGYARRYPGWASYHDLARLSHWGPGWRKHIDSDDDKIHLAHYDEGLAEWDRLNPQGVKS